MHLWAQVIDDNVGGFRRGRRACRISNDNGGVDRGRGIYNASKGSETTSEAAGDRQQARLIYDNNGGLGRGRQERRLQQRQRMRHWRIIDASKGLETTTEAAADRHQAQWIGNDNIVLIVLAISLLTVTLFCPCLFAVLF